MNHMAKMNILFVHNGPCRIFDKFNSGAAVRNTLFVKALTQLGHVDIVSFYKDELRSNIENCNVINVSITSSQKRNSYRGKQWIDLLFRPFSPFTYYYVNQEKERLIDEFFDTNHYDYIACRYIENAVTCGLVKYRNKLILDLDDNPAQAIKIKTRFNSSEYAYKRWKYKLKSITAVRMTRRFLDKVFCSFYSNPLEKPSPKSVLLYNTTSIEEPNKDISKATPFRLFMVGLLDYPPNKEGCSHFVKEVFPLVKSSIPEAELHIAGKCSDYSFLEEMNATDGVKALGFVEDIAREYQDARIIIVPVYSGSGTSVKFIEGLMMNRPVISTSMGARGFEHIFRDEEHYLQARDDRDFANKIIVLLRDMEMSMRLAKNALKLSKECFSQEGFMSTVRETVIYLIESTDE